jgi:hypothetical protein
MCFSQINASQNGPNYWNVVSKENPLLTVKKNSPRIVRETHSHFAKDGKVHHDIHLKESKEPDYFKRNYSPYWGIIAKTVDVNQKSYTNQIKAALEGGHRLKRRDYNIFTAFVYGKKLKYDELDDPLYKQKIIYDMKSRKIKGFDEVPKVTEELIDCH